jgi:hypothetical protein
MELDAATLESIKTSEDALRLNLPTFKFFSDIELFEQKDASGASVKRFKLTASSNGVDLVGDVMSRKSLDSMKASAPGTTVFLNHQYSVPEDVFGRVQKADLVKRSMMPEGGSVPEEMLCLDFEGDVEVENPRAVKTVGYMERGTKLGASVTVLILDRSDAKDGTRIIEDVKYLEVSIVGIPCNRQSWVHAASKALKRAEAQVSKEAPAAESKDAPGPEGAAPAAPEAKAPPAVLDTNSGSALIREDIQGSVVEGSRKDGAGLDLGRNDVTAMIEQLLQESGVKGMTGSTSLPLAPRDTPWAPEAARKRLRANTKTPGAPFKRCHFFVNPEAPESFASYSLAFADLIDGKECAIPSAIFAAAGALQSQRGAAKGLSESDRGVLKLRVSRYYERMREEFKDETIQAPWAKTASFSAREHFHSELLLRSCPSITLQACETCGPESALVAEATPKFGEAGEYVGYSLKCGECKKTWELSSEELAQKGYYNQELDERGLSWYLLSSVFEDCIWHCYHMIWYDDDDGTAALAELMICVDEFAAAIKENAVKWLGLYESPEGSKALLKQANLSADQVQFIAALAMKAGARHNAADVKMIQDIHDLAIGLGGACPEVKGFQGTDQEQAFLTQAAAMFKSNPATERVGTFLATLTEAKATAVPGAPVVKGPQVAELEQKLAAALAEVADEKQKRATAESHAVALQAEVDKWKANAFVAAAAVAEIGQQTLPRAGAS